MSRVVDGIATMGVSDALADRLRELEAEKRTAEIELSAAGQAEIPDSDTVLPAMMDSLRNLVHDIENIASNPNARQGDVQSARNHLQARLGPIELKPRRGVLWAYPAPKAKGLVETSPLHMCVVAGAGFEPATFGL